MSHVSRLKPIIHIGPPKTATTSLQDGIIPHLGRPYQIKQPWTKALARNATFEWPPIPRDVIISDEALGEFAMFPPEVISERLGYIFDDAVVVAVTRDPLDLFFSLFRQKLINGVIGVARILANNGPEARPNTANSFFDIELTRYREFGVGFFQMVSFETNRAIFGRKFDVQFIEFDLLRAKSDAFVNAFVDICGGGPRPPLVHSNKTDTVRMEAMLAEYGLDRYPDLSRRFLDYYKSPALSDDRADLIRNWPTMQRLDAFTRAFRFRDK